MASVPSDVIIVCITLILTSYLRGQGGCDQSQSKELEAHI